MNRPFSEQAGRKVPLLATRIRATLDKCSEQFGITPVEAATLQFISGESGPVYQKDIEKEFGISGASATQRLAQMEKKGLLHRETDPADIRRKKIVVSDQAYTCKEEMLACMRAMEGTLIEGIPEEKVDIFYEVLNRMIANVDKK